MHTSNNMMLIITLLLLCAGCAGTPQESPQPAENVQGQSTTDQPLKPELVVQAGHTDSVNTVAFSPDGNLLASGSSDNTIKIWDAHTGQELRTLAGHTDWVSSVAFSPDGLTLASGSGDDTVKLWDMRTGKVLRPLIGHTDSVLSVAFSSDGDTLASGSRDDAVKLWDVHTGQELRTLTGHTYVVGGVAFSPDGQTLASGGWDDAVILWNPHTGQALRTLTGEHSTSYYSVAFSPNGQTLASGSAVGIELWNVCTGQLMGAGSGNDILGVGSVAFSPDGRLLASIGRYNGTMTLWDVRTGQALHTLATDTDSVSFSPDGRTLASGSQDGTVALWDVRTGQVLHTLAGHTRAVVSVAFSPDGQTLASGGCWDAAVKLWDFCTGQPLRTLSVYPIAFGSMSFSPDGQTLASASDSPNVVTLWDVRTGQELHNIVTHAGSLAFSPDGQTLASGGRHGTMTLWDVRTGQVLYNLTGHTDLVYSVAFSPDGQTLASGSWDDSVTLWNVLTRQALHTLTGHTDEVVSVAFSPDGQTLASGSWDNTVKLWDVRTGYALHTLTGHTKRVRSVAFNPGGQTLVSGSSDNTVKLWDIRTGQELRTFAGHTEQVWFVAFSPEGQTLVSGGKDGRIILWEVESGKRLATLIALDEHDWAVVAPNGQFDASPGAMELMHWIVGLEPINLEQLKDRYYEPGLLPKLLGYSDEPLREVIPFDSAELYPKMAFLQDDPTSPAVRLKLTNRGGGIGKVVVFLNGKEIAADARSRGVDPQARDMELTIDVSGHPYLIPGQENTIEVKAYNAEGYLVSRGLTRVFSAPARQTAPPHLWAVVAGVSDYQGEQLDLRFAAKDAEDMARALQIGAKRLFGVEKVHVRLLRSPEPTPAPSQKGKTPSSPLKGEVLPTRQNVIEVFEAVAQEAKSTDILLVYLSGHGVTHGGQDGDYYFLTADARSGNLSDPVVRQRTAMSSQKLTDLIKAIPALKQVLILDTCASGRLAEKLTKQRSVPSSQIRALDRMKDRTGLHILAGSAADAVSYEASRYGQGLLTYSLLLGMRGAALRDDEYVDISRLFEFAADTVPQLAKDIGGIQRPLVAAPYGGASFDIGRLTRSDKPQIPLAFVRPLVLRANFQDKERFLDHLNLTKHVNDALRDLSARGRNAPLVFVDAASFPDAYSLAGQYTVEDSRVSVTVRLFRNKHEVTRFRVQGQTSDVERLTTNILRVMKKKLVEET